MLPRGCTALRWVLFPPLQPPPPATDPVLGSAASGLGTPTLRHVIRRQSGPGEQDQTQTARHSRARTGLVHQELLHHRHGLCPHGGPGLLVPPLCHEEGLLSGRKRPHPNHVRHGQRDKHVPRAAGDDRHHHDRHVRARKSTCTQHLLSLEAVSTARCRRWCLDGGSRASAVVGGGGQGPQLAGGSLRVGRR